MICFPRLKDLPQVSPRIFLSFQCPAAYPVASATARAPPPKHCWAPPAQRPVAVAAAAAPAAAHPGQNTKKSSNCNVRVLYINVFRTAVVLSTLDVWCLCPKMRYLRLMPSTLNTPSNKRRRVGDLPRPSSPRVVFTCHYCLLQALMSSTADGRYAFLILVRPFLRCPGFVMM